MNESTNKNELTIIIIIIDSFISFIIYWFSLVLSTFHSECIKSYIDGDYKVRWFWSPISTIKPWISISIFILVLVRKRYLKKKVK